MEMTFRWYGSQEEKIALDEIRQYLQSKVL